MKVDVHGSCVSYNIIKKNDGVGPQWKLENVESNLFFSHVNIAGSVLKAISPLPEKDDFKEWNTKAREHTVRNIITDLTKDVIIQLQNSDAEWLMIDFYDFARIQWAYDGGGSYTHVANLQIIAPEYYAKLGNIMGFRWMDIPTFLWYPLVDRYFEQILPKYGKNIILNRVSLSQFCLMDDGTIAEIPENQAYLGSHADNEKIRQLEDYVITKYGLKVIDLSKYFFADYATEHDMLSVHYEKEYYILGGKILQSILNGKNDIQTDQLKTDILKYKAQRCESLHSEFRELYLSKSP